MKNQSLLKELLTLLAVFFFSAANAQYKTVRVPVTDSDLYASSLRKNVAKADDGNWKPIGKGLFRDDMVTALYLVDNYEFEVDFEESTTTPGLYRLVSPYKHYPYNPAQFDGDTYMEINATNPEQVFFRLYDTGLNLGSGNIMINSMAGDYYDKGKFNAAVTEGICGTLKDGVITFPERTLLVVDGTVPDGGGGQTNYKIANANGKFRLKIPGAPDLDVVMTIKDMVEQDGKSFIPVDFNIGKDVEKVKVAMLEGDYDYDMAGGIADGSIASEEISASGEHLFRYEKDGTYTFVAVPYYKGEPKDAVHLTEEFSYLDTDWKDIGTASYTDGFLADCDVQIGIDVVTTQVPVQESTKTPGLFRLVDPYGPPHYQYATSQNYDTSHRYYMEIDASDQNRVVIHKMEYGCGLTFNVGIMVPWSRADRYLVEGTNTKEEIEAMGLYGKCVGNEITFPRKSLCIKFPSVVDTWYWANKNGHFKLVLPVDVSAGISPAGNAEAAPVEYFTLEGMKVGAGNLRPGIYIRRQGTSSSKIIIR